MKVTAVILSAGKGTRMGSDVPKQYLNINGKPMLYYTLRTFENSNVDELVIVTGKDDIEYVRSEIVCKYDIKKVKGIVEGGKERYNSSYNGIIAATGADYILLHDAARPCITTGKINELINEVKKCGACILGVPVKDTIKIVDEQNKVTESLRRDMLWSIQTPQAFLRDDMIKAYKIMFENSMDNITDDSMVMEKFGNKKVKVLLGEYNNIKATTPEDMRVLEEILK